MKLNPTTLSCILALSSVSLCEAAVNYLDLSGLDSSTRTTPVNGRLYFNPFSTDVQTTLGLDSAGYTLSFGNMANFDEGVMRSSQAWFGGNGQWTGPNSVSPYTVGAGTEIGAGTSFTEYGEDAYSGVSEDSMGSKTTQAGLAYGGSGYFGFKINEGGSTYYGWVNVTLNADSTMTYNRIALNETAGESVFAGAVPEPTGLSLAGIGLAAVVFRRCRRASAKVG